MEFAVNRWQENSMSLVRLLGFTTLPCGCVVGRYRELATNREVAYVEEKGQTCDAHGHRRNHTIQANRSTSYTPELTSAKAC
jgi:YD repeat-containing protein